MNYKVEYKTTSATEWRECAGDFGLMEARQLAAQYSSIYYTYRVKNDPTHKKPVVYVAHPVSGQPLTNAMATVEWIRKLITLDPSRVYSAPWVAQVLAFPSEVPGESMHHDYAKAIDDDLEVVSRFDELILVGGNSNGTRAEFDHARKLGKRVTDLSQYKTPKDLPADFFLDPNEETA